MTLSLEKQNRYREAYRARHPNWQPATEVYEKLLRQQVREGMTGLDLGCGRGGVLEQLGDMVSFPIGFDPDLLSLREHRVKMLCRAQALADNLPLQDQSVDFVLCSWVLEHLIDPRRVFQEISRVLRPGGWFAFLTPNSRSLIALLNRTLKPLQQTLVPRLYGRAEADTFPVVYRANNTRQIMKLAAQTGLQTEIVRLVPDPTYLAFHPVLYRLSVLATNITPPVHLVGLLSKP